MKIEWDKSYSVGVERFDQQHKGLFDLLNQLMECVAGNCGKDNEKAREALDGLWKYTASHFTEEEQVLSRHGYPGIAEQEKEHDFLTNKVKKLHHDFYAGKSPLSLDVIVFMEEWLVDHIKVKDGAYTDFLHEKGVE